MLNRENCVFTVVKSTWWISGESKNSPKMRDGFCVRFCKMPGRLHFLRGLFSICVFRLMRWLCQVHEANRCWHWTSAIGSGDDDDDENDDVDDDTTMK